MPAIIVHHRTQGRGVEAVHLAGMIGGFRAHGLDVTVVGPPGIVVDPDVAACAATGRTGTGWGWVARHCPQLFFELLELGYNAAAIPRLLSACRRHRPAFIYERYAAFNMAGAVVSRLTGTPLMLEVNDLIGEDRTRQGKTTTLRGLAGWIERSVCRAARGLFPVSLRLAEQLRGLGVPSGWIVPLPNAVDPVRFDPTVVDRDAMRRGLGLGNEVVIGFSGSFTKWHAVEELVEIFARLSKDRADLRLLLVGDGARRRQVEDLVAARGLGDRVILTGSVPHARVRDYLAAMDIGVMPSSNAYGSPVKIFEYLAMGVPAVGPALPTLEVAIQDGVTGLLFTPDDGYDLERALRRLLDDEQLRARLGAAGRRLILQEHTWAQNALRVLEQAESGSEETVP